jgi:mono/diheme cytochrome c family protein
MSTRLVTTFVAGMLIVAWVAVLFGGCGRSHRGEPQGPEVTPDNAAEAEGERLFARFCYQCHPGGEAGLGPALNDKPLPAAAIRTQIREGVGAMPAFGSELLGDNEVAAIAEYVQELRSTPSTFPAPRLSKASSE